MCSMAKPGRNDPCECGSGRKYKACCQAKHERWARLLRPWLFGRRTADCLVCGAVLPLGQLQIFPDMWMRVSQNSAGEPARACNACAKSAEKEEADAARS